MDKDIRARVLVNHLDQLFNACHRLLCTLVRTSSSSDFLPASPMPGNSTRKCILLRLENTLRQFQLHVDALLAEREALRLRHRIVAQTLRHYDALLELASLLQAQHPGPKQLPWCECAQEIKQWLGSDGSGGSSTTGAAPGTPQRRSSSSCSAEESIKGVEGVGHEAGLGASRHGAAQHAQHGAAERRPAADAPPGALPWPLLEAQELQQQHCHHQQQLLQDDQQHHQQQRHGDPHLQLMQGEEQQRHQQQGGEHHQLLLERGTLAPLGWSPAAAAEAVPTSDLSTAGVLAKLQSFVCESACLLP